MSVEHLEILVEEASMENFLRLLLSKVINGMSFEIYPHQCKQELLARLPDRLRGYSHWLPANWRIIIVVDRDNDDCIELKSKLDQLAVDCGLSTRSHPNGDSFNVVNRLVIEELEAWYFGDWEAVRTAFPRIQPSIPMRAKYRNPDDISGGTWETFERLLQKAGYFKGGLRKIEVARTITPHMSPERNSSHSFQVFRKALNDMMLV